MRLTILPLLAAVTVTLAACDGAGDVQRQPVNTPVSAAPQPAGPTPPSQQTDAPSLAQSHNDGARPSAKVDTSTTTLPPSAPTPTTRPTPVRIAEADGSGQRSFTQHGLLPLNRILSIARRRVPGEVIDVELDDDDDGAEYDIEILTSGGRSVEIKIDARSGAILKVEED